MTLGDRLRRLPLRVRLVAGFSATMFVVLTAAGAFVYWRVDYALDRQINAELTDVSRVVTPFVTASGQLKRGSARVVGDQLYQVLSRDGEVLAHSPALGAQPVVNEATVQEALASPVRRDIGTLLPVKHHPLRAYATALPGDGAAAVLVVAVRRDHRDEALLELLGQLAAAGLGALVVTAFVGERLAKFALRPVERYRVQAENISSGASGVRLDVPEGRDDEVTRLGHTLNAMLDALEEALDSERRFVNDASHELRTPLTLLKTRVQLARRRPRTVSEHEKVLAEIETDIVRLTELANQLLAIGGPPAPPGEEVACDLAAVAEHEASRRNAVSHSSDVAVVVAGPVHVRLDAVPAAQVLGNLLDNASRHGAAPVTVTVDTADGWVRLLVQDSGPGMDPEMLAQATRRFARSAEARSREGFGLGLALVEGIVLQAGGELRLCFGEHHESFGTARRVACDHGDRMTVTVLLPPAGVPARRAPSGSTADAGP